MSAARRDHDLAVAAAKPAAGGLWHELIVDADVLSQRAASWTNLLADCPTHTIFQTWIWQWHWLQAYQVEPWVLFVHDDDLLVGICPFFQIRKPLYTVLRLLGSPHSDYLDLIVRRGYEPAVSDYFFSTVLTAAREIGVVELDAVNERSFTQSYLAQKFPDHLFTVETRKKRCPYIQLARPWDEILAGLSKKMRFLIRSEERRLHQALTVSTGMVSSMAELTSRLDCLMEQHQKRWQAMGKPGAFADERFCQLHRQVAAAFLAQGWLRFCYLDLDGVPVASFDSFAYGESWLYYLGGFDPDYARHSPGVVLMAAAVRQAIAAGADELDLLRGEGAYKFRWTDRERANLTFTLARRSLAVTSYRQLQRFASFLRYR